MFWYKSLAYVPCFRMFLNMLLLMYIMPWHNVRTYSNLLGQLKMVRNWCLTIISGTTVLYKSAILLHKDHMISSFEPVEVFAWGVGECHSMSYRNDIPVIHRHLSNELIFGILTCSLKDDAALIRLLQIHGQTCKMIFKNLA